MKWQHIQWWIQGTRFYSEPVAQLLGRTRKQQSHLLPTSNSVLSQVVALDLPWEMACRVEGWTREALEAKARWDLSGMQ